MKICNKCNKAKETAQFGKDSRNKDGLQGICESCRKSAKQTSRDLRQVGINIIEVTEKKCNKCVRVKHISEFFKDSGISDGHATICKQCKTESSLSWRESNRDQYNATQRAYSHKHYQRLRLNRYKLTVEDHKKMLKEQDSKCAMCNKTPDGIRPLAVDHCHETGKVRGLLCYGCNRLMVLVDNPELLAKAQAYKAKFST